jgi:hypothetical protein
MKNSNHTENEIDKTLSSLDGIQRAVAMPYLFTRIKARMYPADKNFWSICINFISRPAFVAASVLLILLINITIFSQNQGRSVQIPKQDDAQLFASEYNLSDISIYDATTTDQQ